MEEYKFGNWSVNEEGISWVGKPYDKDFYFISKERLDETITVENKNVYNWLIHTAGKLWITEFDIYAFNTAFIFAIDFYKLDYNTCSFVETLKVQQIEINHQ